MRRSTIPLVCAAMVLTFTTARTVGAAPIVVCNTGQAAGCAGTIADGAVDPNYTIIAGLIPGPAKAVIADGFPIPPWLANDADSKWIGPLATDDDANTPPGTFTYRTTFSLAGLNPSTASISGFWGTDDLGSDILINGVGTGNFVAGFGTLFPFSITSGFVSGVNTLDFVVVNGGGPTGLRVDNIVGTANPISTVPEPGMLMLVGAAVAAFARRRRQ